MLRTGPARIGSSADGRRGFTLIELLVVVAVISILATITMPMLLDAIKKSQKAKCKSNLSQLMQGMVLYGGAFETPR